MNQIKRKRKYLRFFVDRLRNVDTFFVQQSNVLIFPFTHRKEILARILGFISLVSNLPSFFCFLWFFTMLSYQNDHSDKRVCYDIETPCDYWHEYQTTIWGHKAMQLCNYDQPYWRLYLSPWKNITKHRWKKNSHSKALGRSKCTFQRYTTLP